MITNVVPTAMIPMNALRVSTLNTLVGERKAGFISAPTMTSTNSPSNGVRALQGMRRRAGAAASGGVVMGVRPSVVS